MYIFRLKQDSWPAMQDDEASFGALMTRLIWSITLYNTFKHPWWASSIGECKIINDIPTTRLVGNDSAS
jgi:hypothetical protein